MSKSATTWFPLAGLLLVCAAQQAGCTLDVAGTGPSVAGTGAASGTTGGPGSSGGGAGTSGSGGAGPSTSAGGGEGGAGGSNTGGGGGAGGGVVVPGYSLELSSDDGSYVEVDNLVIPEKFTIEAWVKRDDEGGDGERMLLAKDRRNQAASQFRLLVHSSGRVAFMMSNAASQDGGLYGSGYEVLSTTQLPVGTWAHVAVSKSGTAFRLYVNGVEEAFYTASQDLTHGGTQPFRIGARANANGVAPDGVFDGQIDEVRLWNVARSQAEIQGAMAQTLDPLMAGPQGLVLSYRFDEGSGTTASDQLGMHPGTLVNGPAWVEDDAAP